MKFEAFVPRTRNEEKYAVAVLCEGRIPMIIQTYHNREQLETGYREWYEFASKRNLVKPIPIEKVDENWKCKILTDLLIQE